MVRIDIRAGSTGKPNKQNERQQWIEFMPTFQDMALKVIEMRQAGNMDLANAMTEMMKETLRRFDERLDIETFIPAEEEGKEDPGMQLQQMQQQLQQMQEQNQQLQQAADANQTKLQIEGDRIKSDAQNAIQSTETERQAIASKERVSAAETNAKAISAENIKFAEINANKELERERIASNERVEMAKAMTSMTQNQPSETQELGPDNHQMAMDEFNKLLTEFIRVMSADRVGVRDQSGRLMRTRLDVQPNQ